MRQKTIIRIALFSIAFTGACLVMLASKPAGKASSCPEPESMENCAKKENTGGGVIWENISHQFFSSF